MKAKRIGTKQMNKLSSTFGTKQMNKFSSTFGEFYRTNIKNGLKFCRMNSHYVFGTMITGINIYNIREKNPEDNIDRARLAAVSVGKGCIYSIVYPISLIGIICGALSDNKFDFKKHFIPCSVYGNFNRKEKE